jgi:tyrosyl-tRNA synthetase
VKLYITDWFAKLNHKMGGDLEKIKIIGKYFIEVFKACGISKENVEFIWASDLMFKDPNYWERVLDITTKTTYKRAIKCSQIMGRSDSDNLDVSQLIYPCMQSADIFQMNVDIPRKCNMLAREYEGKLNIPKPVPVAHHMLIGLKGAKAGKMCKSIPDSAEFMEDS